MCFISSKYHQIVFNLNYPKDVCVLTRSHRKVKKNPLLLFSWAKNPQLWRLIAGPFTCQTFWTVSTSSNSSTERAPRLNQSHSVVMEGLSGANLLAPRTVQWLEQHICLHQPRFFIPWIGGNDLNKPSAHDDPVEELICFMETVATCWKAWFQLSAIYLPQLMSHMCMRHISLSIYSRVTVLATVLC